MKKKILLPFVILLLLAISVFGLMLLRGEEDDWVCVNNDWVKHGNPSSPMPATGCGPTVEPTKIPEAPAKSGSSAGLANPAAVHCEEQKGTSKIITAADGSQSGMCVFADGRQCDEWEFFRTKVCK